DLYAHQPFCQKATEAGFHFLFTCKLSSHSTIAEWVDDFERTRTLGTFETVIERSQGKPKGKRIPKVIRERWTFRFLESVPLRDTDDAMTAN
ncbi:MAG: hypothetical protein M1509_05160, partial [Nitrospirae bacterium]|nr:hypothetical protein [Nitrospirota bacterium]